MSGLCPFTASQSYGSTTACEALWPALSRLDYSVRRGRPGIIAPRRPSGTAQPSAPCGAAAERTYWCPQHAPTSVRHSPRRHPASKNAAMPPEVCAQSQSHHSSAGAGGHRWLSSRAARSSSTPWSSAARTSGSLLRGGTHAQSGLPTRGRAQRGGGAAGGLVAERGAAAREGRDASS
jgi:hypothetical protein